MNIPGGRCSVCKGPVAGNSVGCSRTHEKAIVSGTERREQNEGSTLVKKDGSTQAIRYLKDF